MSNNNNDDDEGSMRDQFAYFSAGGPIYANSATAGLPPRATVAAMTAALDDWSRHGGQNWHEWYAADGQQRAHFASLAGCSEAQVALMPSGSAAAGVVARQLCHSAETAAAAAVRQVVVIEGDFSSISAPFVDHVGRSSRLTITTLALDEHGAVPLEQCLALVATGNVAAVALSAVQSSSGHVCDVARLYAACQKHGARLVLDLAHALLCVPLPAMPAAYQLVSAYKWLLCPKGVAYLIWPADVPLDAAASPWRWWGAHRDPHAAYYSPYRPPAAGAQLLDVSSAWHLSVGAAASLRFLDTQAGGAAAVLARTGRLAASLRRQLRAARLPFSFDGDPACEHCPIVCVACDDPASLVKTLASRHAIQCTGRARYLRLSIFFYNTDDDIAKIVAALRSVMPVAPSAKL